VNRRANDVFPETLICDTSFVGHLGRQRRTPKRYKHWDQGVLDRLALGTLVISVVTVAEIRAGYIGAGWGMRKVGEAERSLATYEPIPIRGRYVDEWARLRVAAKRRGVAISDNDLWIAATATARRQTLVTCDKDHLRLASELPVEVVFLAPPV
jgi:tRNA(fMet)-specific endonuclease VapC